MLPDLPLYRADILAQLSFGVFLVFAFRWQSRHFARAFSVALVRRVRFAVYAFIRARWRQPLYAFVRVGKAGRCDETVLRPIC